MSVDLGIDLGTASVLVYVKGKGVILKEPSVVAYDRDTNAIKAIGEEARMMLGRTPGNIVAVRPLRQGVISDYTVTGSNPANPPGSDRRLYGYGEDAEVFHFQGNGSPCLSKA